jgi:hypothetical protein
LNQKIYKEEFMTTCVFYVDEAGQPDGHSEPLKNGETPLFTLASLAFPLAEWRARDREFLQLKRRFFPDLLGKGYKRDEEYEIKGNELASPHNKTSKRRHQFNKEVLAFIERHLGVGFGVSVLKNPVNPGSSKSIYTVALQILVERFSMFIAEHPIYDNGIIVCDARLAGGLDLNVARSHLSFIFGHETGRTYTNILEAPLFVDSRLTVGIQLCDIFASNLYANDYCDKASGVLGAHDYSHMKVYRPFLRGLEFKSQGLSQGYRVYGYRFLNHNRSGDHR